MKRFSTTDDMRGFVAAQKQEGRTIAFVPTMGALHVGHHSCMDTARPMADLLVASIFVNPTQFSAGEDLDAYPRPLQEDLAKCESWGCDAVFTPSSEDIYPDEPEWVEVGTLAEPMCGRSRPGHFRGVATVVHRLFAIVEPDAAVFGQKDAQQALIIREMVREKGLPVRLALSPTIREEDGLAISSRNSYLREGQRRRASSLYQGLQVGLDAVVNGTTNPHTIVTRAADFMRDSGITDVEYVELRDADSLQEVDAARGHLILAAAIKLGSKRLIDNLVFDVAGDGSVTETPLF